MGLALFVGAWAIEALAVGYYMRMRGFDGYGWTLVAAVFGPIALAVAISYVIRPPERQPRLLRRAGHGSGQRNALVGVDGSPESEAAVDRVVSLIGSELGRLVVARVLPYDASQSTELAAATKLQDLADRHPAAHAGLMVLRGDPAEALRSYAADEHFDVVAVGSRGAGFSTALLGSVASTLAAGSDVPVLIVDTSAAHAGAR